MRIVVQRVLRGQVTVNSELVSKIDRGLMVLLGITHTDTQLDIEYLAQKLLKLRLWHDKSDKAWASNIVENDYEILLVSQFTLYHQLKGTKPDFHDAMNGEAALVLYNQFLEYLKKQYKTDKVQPGAFGQYMNVEIVGDGPVTLVIDSLKDEKAQKKLEKAQQRQWPQKGQNQKGKKSGKPQDAGEESKQEESKTEETKCDDESSTLTKEQESQKEQEKELRDIV